MGNPAEETYRHLNTGNNTSLRIGVNWLKRFFAS